MLLAGTEARLGVRREGPRGFRLGHRSLARQFRVPAVSLPPGSFVPGQGVAMVTGSPQEASASPERTGFL